MASDLTSSIITPMAAPTNPLTTMGQVQQIINAQSANQLTRQQTQNLTTQNQIQTQDLTDKRNAYAAGRISTLAYMPPEQQTVENYDRVINEVEALGGDRGITEAYRSMIHAAQSPAERAQIALRAGMAMVSPQIQQQMATPNQSGVDTGQDYRIIQTPKAGMPNANVPTVAGSLPVYPSRATLATQEQQTDTNPTMPDGSPNPNYGQTINVPMASRLTQQGRGDLAGPAGAGGQVQTGGGQAGGGQNGAPPRLPTDGGQPPPNAATSQGNRGSVPNSVSTGFGTADEPVLRASGEQYAADRARAGTYGQRVLPLMQAITLLKSGAPTGPGTDFFNHMYSFLLSRANQFGWSPEMLRNAVANRDELGKYMQQVVNASPMAAGSDARLASALSGNPNMHISSLANDNVLKSSVGLLRMEQAAILGYNGSNAGYADYLKKFSTYNDPRAFIVDLMDPTARNKMIKGMKPQELAQFQASYNRAKSLNLFTNTSLPANE